MMFLAYLKQAAKLLKQQGNNPHQIVVAADRSESLRSGDRKDVKLKFDEFPFESYDIVKG
ncbi:MULTISPECIES: hypothetical protein [unclassified Chamaesiphon]|uniref:hypothetical protein n=1 Tax=unclassified Chamaesiphon TaxID=2620921 RepID=UPI00286C816E|nr:MULTISPECIES: hypothetical protein [unclassified Chamaesiphon]